MFYIYGLADPHTEIVRYVGQTKDLKKRFSGHLNEARKRARINKKTNWIYSLLKKGLEPTMFVLEENSTREQNNEAEIFHIAQLLDMGFRLTNETLGGDGFYGLDLEAIERGRLKRIGRKASEETKRRMSRSHKKRMGPTEIERLRSISNGTPPNFKGELASNSKLTNKDVISIRKQLNSGIGIAEVAKQYPNMSMQCVHLAGTGRSWAHVKEPVYIPRKLEKK